MHCGPHIGWGSPQLCANRTPREPSRRAISRNYSNVCVYCVQIYAHRIKDFAFRLEWKPQPSGSVAPFVLIYAQRWRWRRRKRWRDFSCTTHKLHLLLHVFIFTQNGRSVTRNPCGIAPRVYKIVKVFCNARSIAHWKLPPLPCPQF